MVILITDAALKAEETEKLLFLSAGKAESTNIFDEDYWLPCQISSAVADQQPVALGNMNQPSVK